jgi:uncharacterized metal-binding protein YceD (DUF177 family)
VDWFKQFVIQFGGLKPGQHHFDFEIDDTFFEHFEYSEIKNGKIAVHLELEKEEKVLAFHFSFDGNVILPCDRCFEPVELKLNGTENLIVKFGDGYYEENEELQIIPEGVTQFDISPFLYEYTHLLLPFRRVHPDDENGNSLCNPEIIKMLEQTSSSGEPDPRWEVLNKLKNNNQS